MATVGADELIDVVSATGQYLRTTTRAEVHAEGLWHQSFHCMVIRPGSGRVVLQRRHQSKAAFPGLLDLSATGHLSAGETPADGIRELEEELGVEIDRDRLVPVGVRLLADDEGEGINRERVHLFFVADDRPLDAFAPDPGEVDGLVEASADDLMGLVGELDGREPAPVGGSGWRPGGDVEEIEVRRADLVKPVDGYWTLLLMMAGRFARGERPIVI